MKQQICNLVDKSRLTAAIISLTLLGGCSSMNLLGDNFHDDLAHWGENKRPVHEPESGSSDLLGASEQARQVERNLGVR